jgi:hypothetical protein
MRRKWLVLGALAVTAAVGLVGRCLGGFSLGKEPEAQDYEWNINGNGFEGVLKYTVIDHRVSGSLTGGPWGREEYTSIEGYQVGRNLVFYRCESNQIWTGWIWETSYGGRQGPSVAGTFSHEGENSYPWYGTCDVRR